MTPDLRSYRGGEQERETADRRRSVSSQRVAAAAAVVRARRRGFTNVMGTQLSRMRLGIEAAEFGLSVLGADLAEQRERVEDFRDFCEFCTQAYRDELMRMWTDYRAKRRPR